MIQLTDSPTLLPICTASAEAPVRQVLAVRCFFQKQDQNADLVDLEQAASDRYRYFCGEIWTRFGEENWLRAWHQVYVRGSGSTCNFIDELSSLHDRQARQAALMICDILSTDNTREVVNLAFDPACAADLRMPPGGARVTCFWRF